MRYYKFLLNATLYITGSEPFMPKKACTFCILCQNSITRPIWQVRLKGITVCEQQSMSNHLQFKSGQPNLLIWKKRSIHSNSVDKETMLCFDALTFECLEIDTSL